MGEEASDKAALRHRLRKTLSGLDAEQKSVESSLILKKLSLHLPPNATCALFCATSREPDLCELFSLRPDLSLVFPRVVSPGKMAFYHTTCLSSLSPGSFGIPEPDPCYPMAKADEIDVIVCPGLAFSPSGQRLGQGGGFYDRYIKKAPQATTIGVGFSIQLLENIPTEEHDATMHLVVTPQE